MAKVGAFRFWCQKVLPLVYDDSISYYELLNKMVVYLNNVISDFNTVAENFDNLDDAFDTLQGSFNDTKNAMLHAYDQLQSFVNDYFDNLDVQEEINNKLDEMAEDGSLAALLQPFIENQISADVAAWLQAHIKPTSPAVDSSLTVSGAAADAKVTGDRIGDLKADLKFFENELFYHTERLTSSEIIAANNNSAVTNNGNGTYTIGTNDRGSTTFGTNQLLLNAGYYLLYGVPNGIAFLSPKGNVSESYNNRVFENTSPEPKLIHITESILLWVCYRVAINPSSEYVIAPSLIKLVPIVDSALKFKGVLESGTDLNNLVEPGIYFLSSDKSYTNAPLTSGYLFVLATDTAIQQICIQYGSALMTVGNIYKRDGSNSGVTTDWHRLGRLFDHNIAFFGDSIMWGKDGSTSANTRTNWPIPTIIGNILQVSTINYGVNGQGFLPTNLSPSTAYDNISGKNLTNFDTLVMCYGVNDGYHLLGEWNSTDETTIMGQFNKIINYVYTQNPTIKVIVFAPFNGTNVGSYPDYWYGNRNNPPYVSRKVLSDTLKRACDYYWIPYIEQYDSPLNAKTITQLLPDGTNPNDEGYKMLGEWFAGKIRGLIS